MWPTMRSTLMMMLRSNSARSYETNNFPSVYQRVMNLIFYIHLVLFLAVVIMPFTNRRENLEFFSVLVPFLFYHWSVNDDTCALTLLEQRVTGKHKDELFMQRLVGPIYKMDDSDLNNAFKTLMFGLWSFAQYRLGHFDFIAEDLKKIIK